jgi:class 3 adenylate cyclase
MDVAAWLQRLGLERYVPAFRDNEIDWNALPKLSAEDLKDLGVVLGGHRRRLLDAIAALGATAPAASATVAPRDAPAPAEAERRQLTVMFCDLVGSTELATRLDPEDLREVVSAYHRVVTENVAGFDGFVAKYMGDGVLVYFGYPRAHEDDAERAVRAGLGVIDAVGRLDVKSVELQARVGIATGLVVVGDLIGEGSARSPSGLLQLRCDLAQLALRLQAETAQSNFLHPVCDRPDHQLTAEMRGNIGFVETAPLLAKLVDVELGEARERLPAGILVSGGHRRHRSGAVSARASRYTDWPVASLLRVTSRPA